MPAGDLHLAVDISAWWTTAVYESGGSVRPVTFDGVPRLPSGVFLDPATREISVGTPALAASVLYPEDYRPDPMTLLRIGTPAPTARFDPVAAVAEILAHVARTASAQAGAEVTTLTVITAQAWGLNAQDRLQQAAARANLPHPDIVTTAAAAAALSRPKPGADGRAYVVVCTAGDATPELTVVDAGNDYQQLATAAVRDPASPTIDDTLIQLAAERAAPGADPSAALDDWRVAREIQQARLALTVQPETPVQLPEPHPLVALTRDDLATAAAPHLAHLGEATKQLLTDAGLAPTDVSAVVLLGDDGTLPGLHAGLTGAGLRPTLTLRDQHTLVGGAIRPRPARTARPPRNPVRVIAACSAALLLQTIVSALRVPLPWESLTLALALAALAAWCAARPALPERPSTGHAPDTARPRPPAGRTQDTVRPRPPAERTQDTAHPRPPAERIPDATRAERPPTGPIVMATAGTMLQQAPPLDMIGGALLGVATGLALTRNPALRLTLATLLGAGYALFAGPFTIAGFVAALAWWTAGAARRRRGDS